jgi:hypothetical protein
MFSNFEISELADGFLMEIGTNVNPGTENRVLGSPSYYIELSS